MSRSALSTILLFICLAAAGAGCSPALPVGAPEPTVPVGAPEPSVSFGAPDPSVPASGNPAANPSAPQVGEPAGSSPEPPPLQAEQRVTLMAVGDIMVHAEQLEGAWDPASRTYRFDPYFARVAPILKQADWVIGNLETTLAGQDLRYTGYPQFNSPESLAGALKRAGFTAVTTANNHSLDRREQGVLRTILHLEQAVLAHTGTFRSADERDQPLLLEKNGIRLAIVAYTYGTNGIPVPKGKPYLVNLIDPQLIRRDIARAHEQGADAVMVSLHFGNEYQRFPDESQKQIVDICIAAGADLIIGHHPHVVQPYEWRQVTAADGTVRTGLAAYSLGNFWSAQRGDYKDAGGIFTVEIRRERDGRITLEGARLIPTYVHFYRHQGKRQYVVYPMSELLGAERSAVPGLTAAVVQKVVRLERELNRHVVSLTKPQPAERPMD